MGARNFGSSRTSENFEILMGQFVKHKECTQCNHKHSENEYTLEELTECENDCENAEFEEGEEYETPDQYECEREREDIGEALSELPYSERESKRGSGEIGLTKLIQYKSYGDVEIGVEIDCFMEVGYHEGGKLDFSIEYSIDGSEVGEESDLSEIIKEFEYGSHLPKGMQVILSKKALKWLEETKEEMMSKIEEVYKKFV